MKIKETKMMPNPSGFGWGEYSQVRELGASEAMPDDAVAVADTDEVSGWEKVIAPPPATPAPAAFPGGIN